LAVLGRAVGSWASDDSCAVLPDEPLPFSTPLETEITLFDVGRSHSSQVTLMGSGYAYEYRVNGIVEVVRGMGYNPRYEGLRPEQRRALHGRDFARMSAAGVNTVFGWDPAQFDGLMLDLAFEHGLGVAPPYDFDWRLDYGEASVRSRVRREVLSWVARYRHHPAVRMWAVGNETFHKLVPPAWCPEPATADQKARAVEFGEFYADLIDDIDALDPEHPVLYREAEESYVEWLREPLEQGGPRPWFVYGLNVYTGRLAEVLGSWPSSGLDSAVLVSEFAPGPEARPDGYGEQWAAIRSHPLRVIGGAVYVWFVEGPEEIDRVYGLVDSESRPVDASLDHIGRLFLAEAAGLP
jgi:beta-galactosidase/beta-glucuronidase